MLFILSRIKRKDDTKGLKILCICNNVKTNNYSLVYGISGKKRVSLACNFIKNVLPCKLNLPIFLLTGSMTELECPVLLAVHHLLLARVGNSVSNLQSRIRSKYKKFN